MRLLVLRRVHLFRHLSLCRFVSNTSHISPIDPCNNGIVSSSTAFLPSKNLRLTLTPAEDSLFCFLEYIQRLYTPETKLRVAGGWVRDKLRGAASEDIDIALDNIMGMKFANMILKFQRDRKLPPSSVGIVKANSNKSKHLEVATVQIEGATVDFVHLRAEEYTQGSRVPEVTFATPADDASRRDLTINALFYNLHTRQVEDFTGKGVHDLIQGIIRTPTEPVQTFLDDPLRVLRAFRFACEFGFTIDSALEKAVREQREIVDAMRRKVSRERIGIEVRKMLSGEDPARAFSLLRDFGLLDLVFSDIAGETDERRERDNVQKDEFPYPPRVWTESIQARASHYLSYLQHSRLSLAKCKISNVESTAAIFAPLFLQQLPTVCLDDLEKLTQPIHEVFDGITEQDIISSSLAFLDRREKIAAALDSSEIVEMLKVHVKWPKPAGKRVALIIEAIATYPDNPRSDVSAGESSKCHRYEVASTIQHRVQQLMWMTQYHSVLAPAMTILVSNCSRLEYKTLDRETFQVTVEMQEKALTRYLTMAKTVGKSDEPTGGDEIRRMNPCRRVDGKMVQEKFGPDGKKGIARALWVLHVWEKIHPHANFETERTFLDRLVPFVLPTKR
ncbi:unnamed protein product [Peronospora belbahrii]|uniref:Poly A polymerase head domain-containing protein n=1 Tax=Peronospora belbahrii TaxID=622444 RepID=A0ABN8CJV5_9STRA|nr:unnamed protein product [Peronospora belbahrii]